MHADSTPPEPALLPPHASLSLRGAARWYPLLLILCAAVVYLNSLNGSFVFDDERAILLDDSARSLWPLDALLYSRRGVGITSFALNHAIHGPEAFGYHVLNVLIHLAGGLALFGIVRRTAAQFVLPNHPPRSHAAVAAAVALLWLVHPLQTQAVTYVVQRFESLASMFYLLTLYCSLRAFQSPRAWRWMIPAIAACALGMRTKEIVVTAPVAVVLMDYAVLRMPGRVMLRHRAPLYVGLFATWLLLLSAGIVGEVVGDQDGAAGLGMQHLSAWQYLIAQGGVILKYLFQFVWPMRLSIDWGTPPPANPWAQLGPAIAVAALVITALVLLIRRRWYGYVAFFFFLALAPTSSFVPVADLVMEHRVYLALAGPIILVVAAVRGLLLQVGDRWPPLARSRQAIGVTLVLVAALLLSIRTIDRNNDYVDPVALWSAAAETVPLHARAHHNLAHALQAQGRTQEAIEHYKMALRIQPDYTPSRNNLGALYHEMGRIDLALEQLERVVETKPDDADAVYNLGRVLMQAGRWSDARDRLIHAATFHPEPAQVHNNLGVVYMQLGEADMAAEQFQAALGEDPTMADAQANLGLALRALDRLPEAVAALQEACRLAPGNASHRRNLARTLAASGRLGEAAMVYHDLLAVSPRDVAALVELAMVHQLRHQPGKALRVYEAALAIQPAHGEALRNVAWIRATAPDGELRDGGVAVTLARQAARTLHQRDPLYQDTLAAALAEAGDFEAAADLAQRAADVVREAGSAELADLLAQRAAEYARGRPWRQAGPSHVTPN